MHNDKRFWFSEGPFVAVTTDATLCPARSSTTREGYLTKLTGIACTLQPVNPRSTNRLNLRNELDSLGIDDFLERTDHHLPYPLRRTRPTTLVVAVTFGVVDTCSTSSGCLRPTIDWGRTGLGCGSSSDRISCRKFRN